MTLRGCPVHPNDRNFFLLEQVERLANHSLTGHGRGLNVGTRLLGPNTEIGLTYSLVLVYGE